jgi:hypothetical protein
MERAAKIVDADPWCVDPGAIAVRIRAAAKEIKP